MIVLDATNKSLELKADGGSNVSVTMVVTYWSVDSSNVWTPRSFESSVIASNINATPHIMLAAPAAGVTLVVENIWLHFTNQLASGHQLDLQVVTGAVARPVASIIQPASGLTIQASTVFSMGRDGKFSRQIPQASSTDAGNSFNSN